MTDPDQTWWWDLRLGRAVTDEERGADRDVLGPYPSRQAAEAWRGSHDAREEAWEDEDERWDGEGDGDGRPSEP